VELVRPRPPHMAESGRNTRCDDGNRQWGSRTANEPRDLICTGGYCSVRSSSRTSNPLSCSITRGSKSPPRGSSVQNDPPGEQSRITRFARFFGAKPAEPETRPISRAEPVGLDPQEPSESESTGPMSRMGPCAGAIQVFKSGRGARLHASTPAEGCPRVVQKGSDSGRSGWSRKVWFLGVQGGPAGCQVVT
jgi:hypothetical protein